MSDDRVFLTYILECIANLEDLTRQGRRALESDRHHRAAALHYLQTMAETTQRVSEALKATHPEVDWVAISGFRNRLVHGYLEINMDIIWNVIEYALPGLKTAAGEMRQTLTGAGEDDESPGEGTLDRNAGEN